MVELKQNMPNAQDKHATGSDWRILMLLQTNNAAIIIQILQPKLISLLVKRPPCQTFFYLRSAATNRQTDPRDTFEEYVRLLKILRPTGSVRECLWDYRGHKMGEAWKAIQATHFGPLATPSILSCSHLLLIMVYLAS